MHSSIFRCDYSALSRDHQVPVAYFTAVDILAAAAAAAITELRAVHFGGCGCYGPLIGSRVQVRRRSLSDDARRRTSTNFA